VLFGVWLWWNFGIFELLWSVGLVMFGTGLGWYFGRLDLVQGEIREFIKRKVK